jgi:hypothetical protein
MITVCKKVFSIISFKAYWLSNRRIVDRCWLWINRLSHGSINRLCHGGTSVDDIYVIMMMAVV